MHTPKTHRIGLLTPSSNTTQEPEFCEVLPESVSLHAGRLTLNNIDAESTLRIVEQLEAESRKLGDAEVDVIVLAATAPSARLGKGYDRELVARMQGASGKPATTASTALLEALALLGMNRIALVAPWSEAVNENVARFIEAHGIEVPHRAAMGIVRNNDVGRLDPEVVYRFARASDGPRAQAMLLGCGNWWTMSIVERLEREIGKPVLTTNGVSIWGALKPLGYASLPGYGTLLRDHLGARSGAQRVSAA